MTGSTIHFTQPVESFGDSVHVKETPGQIAHSLTTALRYERATIEATTSNGNRQIIIPVSLVGPIVARD